MLFCTAILLFAMGALYAQRPMKGGEQIELGKFRFRHPMTVTTAEEIKEVQKRIRQGVEPQVSAYRQLIADAEAVQGFVPDPPDSMYVMGGYEPNSNLASIRRWMWRNCSAAYASALAYAYSGEVKYAEKAVEILNAWAVKQTFFTGQDRGLQLGSYFSPMLYAADLLHSYKGWKEADRIRFRDWWIDKCLVHTHDVMVHRDNNWKDAGLLGVMCAAVVFEEADLLEEALNELSSYFRAREDKNVKIKGPYWKIQKDERGVYFPREVVRNEGRSGLTYTGYTLTTLVQCMEIARYAGYDFWTARTPEGASLQEAIEQFFRWMIMGDTFPWNPDPARNNEGFRYNTFEIAKNQCPGLMPEIGKWVEQNRPVKGAQGDEYSTLNKGDMPRVRK